jgi:hypothetical protein
VCENPYKMEEPVASNYSPTSITINWAALTDRLSGTGDVLEYELLFRNTNGV